MTTLAAKLRSYRQQLAEKEAAFHTTPVALEGRKAKLIKQILRIKEKITHNE